MGLRETFRSVFASGRVPKALGTASQGADRPPWWFALWDHVHPTTPAADNTTDFATSALRWANGYFRQLRPGSGTVIWTSGAGTPEASVTAPIGSLYTRSDGGANTTLYVKESGAGNTGWVAK